MEVILFEGKAGCLELRANERKVDLPDGEIGIKWHNQYWTVSMEILDITSKTSKTTGCGSSACCISVTDQIETI